MIIQEKNDLITNYYTPTEQEEYMNPTMLAYFRNKLIDWKTSIANKDNSLLEEVKEQTEREADHVDEGIKEETRSVDYGLLTHDTEIMKAIDEAIDRISKGDYGYCIETGEEIGIKRLEAWPIANLTIEAQKKKEKH